MFPRRVRAMLLLAALAACSTSKQGPSASGSSASSGEAKHGPADVQATHNGSVIGPLSNSKLKNYPFLKSMVSDSYFPKVCVHRVREVLVGLCRQIEGDRPEGLAALYRLTHRATERINGLATCFDENNSEIETTARESIAGDFAYIAEAYGYKADIEELIAPRDW